MAGGAQIRFRNVIEKYQTTSLHAPEALYRMVESSLSLGIPEEAQKKPLRCSARTIPALTGIKKAFRLMNRYAPGTKAI